MPTEKKEMFVTPAGIARWPWLNKPDVKFDPDKQGKFKVNLLVDPNDDGVKEFLILLRDHTKAAKPDGKVPYVKERDQDGNETGKFLVHFKSIYRPKVFDMNGRFIPDEVQVGNDSKIKVAYTENVYDGFGGGVNLYLNAVQVIELVEPMGTEAGDYGFDTTVTDDKPAGDVPQDDNLPF